MLKKLYIVGLILCFFVKAQSQYLYTKQSLNDNPFYGICEEINSGNYLLATTSATYTLAPFSLTCTPQLLKIDPNGVLLDSIQLEYNFAISAPILTHNNCYYIFGGLFKNYGINSFGYFLTAYKYDVNFNLVKKVILDSSHNNFIYGYKLTANNNRIFAAYSRVSNNTSGIFKLDLNLGKIDSVSFVGEVSDMNNYNNDLVVLGSDFPNKSVFGNYQVAKYDTSLNTINRFNLDSLTYLNPGCGQKVGLGFNSTILETGNNNYFISGAFSVVQNATCTTQLSYVSSIVKANNTIKKTHIVSNASQEIAQVWRATGASKRNSIIYSMAIVDYPQLFNGILQKGKTQILVNKLDTDGNLLWTKYYGGDMFYCPYTIYATSDGGAIICGMRYDSLNPRLVSVHEGFVMKINKSGELDYVGIKENETISTQYHKLYPNPSQNELYFDIPLQTNIEITIYDLLGREERRVEAYQNLSALNISELKPGTHIYKIKTTSAVFSGKFVKE